jgi:hypothetical protein
VIKEWISNSSGRVLLLIITLAFVGGVFVGKRIYDHPDVVCPVAVQQTTKTTEHTSLNKVIKTVKEIKHKDGTVSKTTTTEHDSSQVFKKDDEHVVTTPSTVLTKYSLGVEYLPSLSEAPSVRDIEIEGGARLGESPVWLKTGYDLKHNQLKLGLEYQF